VIEETSLGVQGTGLVEAHVGLDGWKLLVNELMVTQERISRCSFCQGEEGNRVGHERFLYHMTSMSGFPFPGAFYQCFQNGIDLSFFEDALTFFALIFSPVPW
jgi:hypothetical protein